MKTTNKDLNSEERTESFFSYLTNTKNRKELLVFSGIYLVLYVVLLTTYGYPTSTSDSGSYLASAESGIINGYRPIGYSWILDFFHKFFPSFTGIFTSQFLFNAVAQLVFLYTIKYFFDLNKKLFYPIAAFFILSPSILYCTFFIMSDGVFHSLTLIYLATSLFLIKRPSIPTFLIHMIALYLVFNVRYSALFYPLLSSIIFLLHAKRNKAYIPIAIFPILLLMLVYDNTQKETKRVFGIKEFSGFGGWALANNAVSIIPYIDLKAEDIEDPELQVIHQIVTSVPDENYSPASIRATNFMWAKTHAGKQVLGYNRETTGLSYVPAWIYSGSKFRKYGTFLIKKYPIEFAQYFLWENVKNLFAAFEIPTNDQYATNAQMKRYYNTTVDKYVIPSPFLHHFDPVIKVSNFIVWILFIASVLILLFNKNSRREKEIRLLQFLVVYAGIYIFFSIVAHPINNFRYLIPLYCVQLALPAIVLNNLLFLKQQAPTTTTEEVA